ncbi:hypothetical protein AMTRI_Chr01g102740 [Amborella trichopoda]
MDKRKFVFPAMAMAIMACFSGVLGQVAPSGSPDCTSSLQNLVNCLSYVLNATNVTTPESGCCPALSDFVSSTPICLCQIVEANNTYGLAINRTRVLMLPSACKVSTPPLSTCAVVGIPVPGPIALIPAAAAPTNPITRGRAPTPTSMASEPSPQTGSPAPETRSLAPETGSPAPETRSLAPETGSPAPQSESSNMPPASSSTESVPPPAAAPPENNKAEVASLSLAKFISLVGSVALAFALS